MKSIAEELFAITQPMKARRQSKESLGLCQAKGCNDPVHVSTFNGRPQRVCKEHRDKFAANAKKNRSQRVVSKV